MSEAFWGFPRIRGIILGVPIRRIIDLGVYLGFPLFWENTFYHNSPMNLGVKRGTSDFERYPGQLQADCPCEELQDFVQVRKGPLHA